MRMLHRRHEPAAPTVEVEQALTEYPLEDIDGYVMTHRGIVGVVVEKVPAPKAMPGWRTALACFWGTLLGLTIGVGVFVLIGWSILHTPLS